jgi:hypothetical protein
MACLSTLVRRVVPPLLAATLFALVACGGSVASSAPHCAIDPNRPYYGPGNDCGASYYFTFNGTTAECGLTDGGLEVQDSAGHAFTILSSDACRSLCAGGPPDAAPNQPALYCTLNACESLSGVDPACQPGETVLACSWGECGS